MRTVKLLWRLISGSVRRYWRSRAWRYAASISFYSLFTVAPLLLFVAAIGGALVEQEVIRRQALRSVTTLIGEEGAGAVSSIMTLLIWFYLSVQLFLAGASFLRVYAEETGSWPAGERGSAPRVTDEDLVEVLPRE